MASRLKDSYSILQKVKGYRLFYVSTITLFLATGLLQPALAFAQSTTVDLTPNMPDNGTVGPVRISPDGRYAVFIADIEVNDDFELYSVPIDGSNPPQRLTDGLCTEECDPYRITPDSRSVVYLSDSRDGLYTVPISYTTSFSQVTPIKSTIDVISPQEVWTYYLSPSNRLIAYRISDPPATKPLYYLHTPLEEINFPWNKECLPSGTYDNGKSVTFDPTGRLYFFDPDIYDTATNEKIATMDTSCDPFVRFSPNGEYIVLRRGNFDKAKRWIAARMDSPTQARSLFSSDIVSDTILFDSKSAYAVAMTTTEAPGSDVATGLARADLAGDFSSFTLTEPFVSGGRIRETIRLSPDDQYVLYRADQETVGRVELYQVPVMGGNTTKLSIPLEANQNVTQFAASPDGQFVIYTVLSSSAIRLFVVPITGGDSILLYEVPRSIVGTNTLPFDITPDSTQVIFNPVSDDDRIYSTPILGGNIELLSGIVDSGVDRVEVTPDGESVIFVARHGSSQGTGLYAARLPNYDVSVLTQASTPQAGSGDTVAFTTTIEIENGINIPYQLMIALPEHLDLELSMIDSRLSYNADQNELRTGGALMHSAPLVFHYTGRINEQETRDGETLLVTSYISANGNTVQDSETINVQNSEPTPVPILMLIYAAGDNNLDSHMPELIDNVTKGATKSGITVVMLVDRAGEDNAWLYKWNIQQGDTQNLTPILWADNLAARDTLQGFLKSQIVAYPAERIFVALVGHGGGWSSDLLSPQPGGGGITDKPGGGFLWDETSQSSLSIQDMGQALRAARQEVLQETGREQLINLLYLDACLMAMSEVGYEVRDSVNYLLASENFNWTTFAYDLHLSTDIVDQSTETIGQQWIHNEVNRLKERTSSGSPPPYTYSFIDLGHIDELVAAENEIALQIMYAISDTTTVEASDEPVQHDIRQILRDAHRNTECFDGNQDYAIVPGKEYYCDLLSFSDALREQIIEEQAGFSAIVAATNDLSSAIKNLVVKEMHNREEGVEPNLHELWSWENLGGISKYLPLGEDDWKRAYYNSYNLQIARDGQWDEFLNKFWVVNPPLAPAICTNNCTPQGPLPVGHKIHLPLVVK